jgi:hypothetical protein
MRRMLLLAAALGLAGPVLADPAESVACLDKQARAQRGAEARRVAALQAHFRCFPEHGAGWAALFGAGAPLAPAAERHLELRTAARGATPGRRAGLVSGGGRSSDRRC